MLRDSVGLMIAVFGLIVCFAAVTDPVLTAIDNISSANSDVWSSTTLKDTLYGAYYMMYGFLGVGIFIWYYGRMHRDEYEKDYFTQSGWQFKPPKTPQYPLNKMRWR